MSEWSKEFPKVEGFYWARRTQTNRSEAKVIEVWQYEGDWYAYRGGDGRDIEAENFAEYEFLGPVSPADTERLVRLGKALEPFANMADEILATDPPPRGDTLSVVEFQTDGGSWNYGFITLDALRAARAATEKQT